MFIFVLKSHTQRNCFFHFLNKYLIIYHQSRRFGLKIYCWKLSCGLGIQVESLSNCSKISEWFASQNITNEITVKLPYKEWYWPHVLSIWLLLYETSFKFIQENLDITLHESPTQLLVSQISNRSWNKYVLINNNW